MKSLLQTGVHDLDVSCKACSLIDLCVSSGLDDAELAKLDEVIETKAQYEAAEYLYHAGDEVEGIFAVRSGMVKTFISNENGAEQITGFYLPGELVGLDGLGSEHHACNAVALGTTTVCRLRSAQFDWAVENIPGMRNQLFRMIGTEFNHEQKMLLALGQMKADERLATFLLSLSERFKRRGFSSLEFFLSMPRHDLANYLGLAPETLSRVFSKMQDNGILHVEGRNVRILDMQQIIKLAHCCGNN